MRPAALLVLVLALVLGGAAAFLTRSYLTGLNAAPIRNAETIVVATQNLSFGAALSGDNTTEIQWPSSTPLEGAFITKAQLLDEGKRIVLVPIQRNEPVLANKVTGPNQRATLSTLIDEGMRAVTVRVDDVRGVAGFVLPGDRVDVVVTRGEGGNATDNAFADVLLQNVKVLAIDQVAGERQDKPAIARAVTLELNMQQSQKVILAQGVGRLSLVLRQAGGAKEEMAQRVTVSDLGLTEVVRKEPRDQDKDRIAALEAQALELKAIAAASRDEAKQAAVARINELEAELRKLQEKPAQPVVVKDPNTLVTVIRAASKREQYSVMTEKTQ